MDFFKAVEERCSTRKYSGEAVPRNSVETIIHAGRLAPTARNEQPWEFVAVTDRARLKELGGLTDHGKFIAEAGACIAVLCHPTKYYLEDGCAATENMLLAATALGLHSCWVAGDKKAYAPRVCEFLGAPPECKLVSLIALGFAAAPPPRARKKALSDLLHWERF